MTSLTLKHACLLAAEAAANGANRLTERIVVKIPDFLTTAAAALSTTIAFLESITDKYTATQKLEA